jgi:DNA-binding response OmpR family regulator
MDDESAVPNVCVMTQPGPRLRFAELQIDLEEHRACLAGKSVEFSLTEFRLLSLLAANPGRTFTREEILVEVHGSALVATPEAVNFQICQLRKKLGPAAAYLKTVRGVGYRFAPPASPAL